MTAKFRWVVDDGLAARLRLARFETLHESVARSRRASHKFFALFEVTFFPVCDKTPSIRITVFRWKLNCSRTLFFFVGFACRAEVTAKSVIEVCDALTPRRVLTRLLALLEIGLAQAPAKAAQLPAGLCHSRRRE